MKILKRNMRGIYRHNCSYKKDKNVLKMIKENHNKESELNSSKEN
jgi:hypothetical protein